MRSRHILLLLVIFLFYSPLAHSQERISTVLRNGWKFSPSNHDMAYQAAFDDTSWKDVQVPHDWAVEQPFIIDGNGNTGKLPWKGEGWYRNQIQIPAQYKGKKVYLLFDGIMAFPCIYINGRLAGRWDYGYNSFYLDITEYVNIEENNLIAIHVDTREHDSRWYPGAGIYRKIQMIALNPIHVDIWGTYIKTPIIKPHYADVTIATTINNHTQSEAEVKLKHTILTDDQKIINENEITGKIGPNNGEILETTVTIPDPRLWDIDDPQLYTVNTEVYSDDQLLDTYTVSRQHKVD